MNIPLLIAKKYFGKYLNFQSTSTWNSIQVLTAISVFTAMVISAATILILSVFNGLVLLLGDLNTYFYPDLKMEPSSGKVFSLTQDQLHAIQNIEGVESASRVLEEIALFDHYDHQTMGIVKGVDENYSNTSAIDQTMYRGKFTLENNGNNFCVLGLGISNQLNINIKNPLSEVSIFVPQRKPRTVFGIKQLLGRLALKPAGEFIIQQEFDNKYVFVPYKTLKPILQYENEVSYIELKLLPNAKPKKIKEELLSLIPNTTVKNREQQNESWYKVMRFEKWMSFSIILFIMIIASFNLLSSLTMVVLDKKKDISILRSMGMTAGNISSIFIWQGLLIGLVGSVIGALFASIIVLAQQQFGIVPLRGSFVVDSYPIQLKTFDVLLTVLSISAISFLASIIPAVKAKKFLHL